MLELHIEPYSDDKDLREGRPNMADIVALVVLILSVIGAFFI